MRTHSKKTSTLAILLSTLLLTSMLLLGVVQSSTDFVVSNPSKLSRENNYLQPVDSNQTSDHSLVINEFMADNSITAAGPEGNSPDWIELFNAGNNTIDLTGMYLTDDLTDPKCWQLPEGTKLGPGGFLIVWADRDGGEIYASFGLNANGEEIGLFDSDGLTLLDSVMFSKQIQDVSYGRIPDGGSSWNYLPSATPGFSNQDPSIETRSSVWSLVMLIIAFVVVSVCIFLTGKIRTRMKK